MTNREVVVFERFTDASRRAVAVANQETHRLGGDIIGDVELLIGLTKESDTVPHRALSNLGVSMGQLQRELEQQPRSLNDGTAPQRLPQTREFKLAIEAAIAAAREAGEYVDTGHMLLGLLRYPEFASSRVLAQHSVSLEKAKQEIASICSGGTKGAQ